MPQKFQYDLVAEAMADGDVKLFKYKSKSSGMNICIADVNGPLVKGHFTFATETFDNDGLPHTLEHLVFLGSEKYPYKGILDMLANRCLSNGTNASTSVDCTSYTVTTAGSEGFLNILPIYLDHLFFPTLTDSAFITEIHHINGEGKDGGVVYCEMEGKEGSAVVCSFRTIKESMYPEDCGYRYTTGGRVQNLRESTTNEKVRKYHKHYYRPENLSIAIIGHIDVQKVFKALIPIEEKLLLQGQRSPFFRPWQYHIPHLSESFTHKIEYPAEEDTFGMVIAAWMGPDANNFFDLTAVNHLLSYLTYSAISPFRRDMVEIDDPLCFYVGYTIEEKSVACISLQFDNVPRDKIEEVKEKMFSLLQNVADGTEEINMNRLRKCIKKGKSFILNSIESSPYETLEDYFIKDFLYGKSNEDFQNRIREIPILEELLEKRSKFWADLTKKYFIGGHHVVVLASSSPEVNTKILEEERQRVEEQQEELGPDGLMEKAEILKKAIETNSILPPSEVITSVPIPSADSIDLHPIMRICNFRRSKDDNKVPFAVQKMPCRFHMDVIKTKFPRMTVIMDTNHLPLESRMYLPLLIRLFTECAVKRNGVIVPYEDVVQQTSEELMGLNIGIGMNYQTFFCGNFAGYIFFMVSVEEHYYEKGIQWLHEILFQSFFEPARIKAEIQKMISCVSDVKEDRGAITRTMITNMMYARESNHWSSSAFRQSVFLNKILREIDQNPGAVLTKLYEILASISRPGNVTIHLLGNIPDLPESVDPEEPWISKFFPTSLLEEPKDEPKKFSCCSCVQIANRVRLCLRKDSEFINPIAEANGKGMIIGMGTSDSSCLMQITTCPLRFTDPDCAALSVLSDYLGMAEGPMWRKIRGAGLAYSYNLQLDIVNGTMHFALSGSPHLVQAYRAAYDIIDSHLNGSAKWDTDAFESAKSSSLSSILSLTETVFCVAGLSMILHCSGYDMDLAKDWKTVLHNISKVTIADMERAGKRYLKPLFNPELSWCAIACSPADVEDIRHGFKEISRDLRIISSVEESFFTEYETIKKK